MTSLADSPTIKAEHPLDAPALPERRLGAQETISETKWMQLWPSLAAELCIASEAFRTGRLALATVPRLAAAVSANATENVAVPELKAFCQGILRPLAEDALERLEADDHGLHAVLGWQLFLNEADLQGVAEALSHRYPSVYAALNSTSKTATQELTARMWRTGNANALVGRAVPELRRIAISFFDALDELEDRRALVPRVLDDEAKRLLRDVLLPRKLALALDPLAHAGKDVTVENFDPIITGVQNRAFTRLERVVESCESMLVLGPPGCGKTRVGQVAAAYAVHSARRQNMLGRALIIVPTKTMVRENHRRWQEWTRLDDERWEVVAGSADDREYDEALATGNYDIGICVYEKLASLIYGRSDVLNRVRLIVVDELQNLGHRERGVNVEALLTILKITHPEIPLIGLSATLSRESTKTLRRWLDIKHVVETQSRPVNVRVHVIDGVTRRSRLVPAAKQADDDSDAPVPVDEGNAEHRLAPPDDWPDTLRQRAMQLAVTVPVLEICHLLADPSVVDRRVLCFVRDRDRAREVAQLIAQALQHQSPLPRTPRNPNPWTHGRYAGDLSLSAEERDRRFREFLWTEDHRWRRDVLDGLLSGVAYHTRTLQTGLRRWIEDEFDTGLVRVLVCTETLAEGVNLAASDVVVADVTHRGRLGHELISLAQMKNRLGRAGRLGKTEAEGNAYVALNPRYPRNQLADPALASRVTDVEPAWNYWVAQAAPEEGLRSDLADPHAGHDNLCGLVLRALAVDQRRLTRPEMVEEIDRIIRETYWAAWGGHADAQKLLDALEAQQLMEALTPPDPARPNGDAVIDRLVDERLVAPIRDIPDLLQVTKLGMSIARSALPLGSSISIRNLASAARLPFGEHSLRFLAAQDPSVRQTLKGKWLSWPKPWGLRGADRATVIKRVQFYVDLYGHPSRAVREKLAEEKWQLNLPYSDGRVVTITPDPKLVRRDPNPVAPELRRWVMNPRLSEDPDDPDYDDDKALAVAAFRATVAHEWGNFQRFEDIRVRLDSIKTARRKTRHGKYREPEPAIAYSITDIEQLGERLGYVLGAASEFIEDNPDAQGKLQDLAQETGLGIPTWLAPLARLQVEGLGREALISIHRTGRGPVENLEEALGWEDARLSDEVRAKALAAYAASRSRIADGYRSLPLELQYKAIASQEGRAYADLWRDLMEVSEPSGLTDTVRELLHSHLVPAGVRAEEETAVASLRSEAGGLDLVFFMGDFNREALKRLGLRKRVSVAVPLRPPNPSIDYALTRPGVRARAIRPKALILLLYGLRADHEAGLEDKLARALLSRAGYIGIAEAQRMLEAVRLAPVDDELYEMLASEGA